MPKRSHVYWMRKKTPLCYGHCRTNILHVPLILLLIPLTYVLFDLSLSSFSYAVFSRLFFLPDVVSDEIHLTLFVSSKVRKK